MKKTHLVVLLLLTSLFTTQEAQAVENEEFWFCAAAVAGFDLAAIVAHQSCGLAITAPSFPTVIACLTALGTTAVTGGVAWLTCSSFLENECEEGPGTPAAESECSDNTGSPILLDLDRNQFHLSGGPVVFDIDSDARPELVTWVSPNNMDAFLYLDRNGNGVADNGLELFGDATLLVNYDLADNGYEALAEFDLRQNGGFEDGFIDVLDSVFLNLRVWVDENADGVCEHHETLSLAEAGVLSIDLDYKEMPRRDGYGNEFRYVGSGWMEVNGKKKRMSTTDVFFKILAE